METLFSEKNGGKSWGKMTALAGVHAGSSDVFNCIVSAVFHVHDEVVGVRLAVSPVFSSRLQKNPEPADASLAVRFFQYSVRDFTGQCVGCG